MLGNYTSCFRSFTKTALIFNQWRSIEALYNYPWWRNVLLPFANSLCESRSHREESQTHTGALLLHKAACWQANFAMPLTAPHNYCYQIRLGRNTPQVYLSTMFRQETPSWPPTAYRYPPKTATPTLVRHVLVGATSLLHWLVFGSYLKV